MRFGLLDQNRFRVHVQRQRIRKPVRRDDPERVRAYRQVFPHLDLNPQKLNRAALTLPVAGCGRLDRFFFDGEHPRLNRVRPEPQRIGPIQRPASNRSLERLPGPVRPAERPRAGSARDGFSAARLPDCEKQNGCDGNHSSPPPRPSLQKEHRTHLSSLLELVYIRGWGSRASRAPQGTLRARTG